MSHLPGALNSARICLKTAATLAKSTATTASNGARGIKANILISYLRLNSIIQGRGLLWPWGQNNPVFLRKDRVWGDQKAHGYH